MDAARQLESPLLAANYQTLIGLMAVTGFRLGEVDRTPFVGPPDLTREKWSWHDGVSRKRGSVRCHVAIARRCVAR